MSSQIALILGPLVTGVVLNAFLFGICAIQFATYFTANFDDRAIIKSLVYFTFTVDTFYTISSVYMLWVYVVDNFNNPAILSTFPWPYACTPLITAFTAMPIQLFLAWRIKQFSSSRLIFWFISCLSFAQGALGLVSSAYALAHPQISYLPNIIPTVDAWNAISMVCDVAITCFLVRYLRKSRTGHKHTDGAISKLILQSVEMALFPSLFGILDFITFTVLQHTTIYSVFGISLGRIYTNTLLTTLNSRIQARNNFSNNARSSNVEFPVFPMTNQSSDPENGRACDDGTDSPDQAIVVSVSKEISLTR